MLSRSLVLAPAFIAWTVALSDSGWAQEGAARFPTRSRIAEIQARVAAIVAESPTYDEGAAALARIPEAELVPAVIDAVVRGVYEDGKTRGRCYWILGERGAVSTEEGYRAMLMCLDDSPAFLGVCVDYLAKAPPEKLPEVAARFAAILRAEGTDHETVLKGLSKVGKFAVAHLAYIESILTDPEGDPRLRSFAAQAVLNISGPKRAIEVFSGLDEAGLRESLGPLNTFAGESQGTFGTDDKTARDDMRAFMARCMRHPNREIRKLAAQGFVGAYTKEEVWVDDPVQGRIMNPRYVEPWAFMAQNDPDQTLRDLAAQRVAKIQKAQRERAPQ